MLTAGDRNWLSPSAGKLLVFVQILDLLKKTGLPIICMNKSAVYFQDPADEKMFLQSSSQVFTSSEQGIFAHQPLTPQCDIQTDGQSNGFN